METLTSHWSWIIIAGIVCAAWVAVEWLKRRCPHKWVKSGKERALFNPFPTSLPGINDGRPLPYAHEQQMVCEHCGKIKVVRV